MYLLEEKHNLTRLFSNVSSTLDEISISISIHLVDESFTRKISLDNEALAIANFEHG